MTFNATESFNQALEIFSSLYQDMAPPDVPPGLSPDCQDIEFLPGSVFTRRALNKFFSAPQEPTSDLVSVAEYPLPDGDYLSAFLYSTGNLFQSKLSTGVVSQIGSVAAGCQFKSANAFNKQWFAFFSEALADQFSDSPYCGADIPRYYDGKNVWRVTQDAPGGNPVFASIPTLPVNLAQTTPTGTLTVTAVQSTDPQIIYTPSPKSVTTTYSALLYTCSAPVPASWLGTTIGVTGVSGTNASLANVSAIVIAVSGNTFTLGRGTGSAFVNLGGQSATATLAGNYFTRNGNIVTAYLGTSIPPNFQTGLFAKIINSNASAINGPNWTIDATGGILRDATGLVTVTIDTQLTNLAAGSQLFINAADVTDFPASLQTVYQVISATGGKTVFTISNPTWGNGAVATSNAGGAVYQVWSGVFQIQSVGVDNNGNAFFTYFQLGPDATLNSTGGTPQAQIQSQIPPGIRNAVLMFKSTNGALTAPSIPIQISVVGGTTLLGAQVIPIGPPGTAQRVIALTPAYGSSYYYITPSIVPSVNGLPPVLSSGTIIPDNTTTNAVIDFSDQQLTAGTQIDIQGNNLFDQIVLAPSLGCIEYDGRMFWWGEINNIKNLINMGFDGGYATPTYGGSANSGGLGASGVAWTNYANITSPSSYTEINLTSGQTSQALLSWQYNLSVTSPPGATVAIVTVTANAYYTSTGNSSITAKLLKAGSAIGSAATVALSGSRGSAGNPTPLQFTFTLPALLAADLNILTFGAQFVSSCSSGTLDLFMNNAQISASVDDLFPLGWDGSNSTGGTGVLVPNGTLGFSYRMTGAGGDFDCLIEQPFYKDYYGEPIATPGALYVLRLLMSASGTTDGLFVCQVVSPTQGILASVGYPTISPSSTLSWVVLPLPALPATIPSDTLIRIYLQSSHAVVTIDETSLIDTQFPVNFQQMRASYYRNPFGYDNQTGICDIDGAWKITAAFTQRGYLYALTDGPMFQTQNNGTTEPNDWTVTKFADECDCYGPNAVVFTEDLAWWAGPLSGARIFNANKPAKISQEVQQTWNLINDNAPLSVWLANDPDERSLYIGVPTGESTTANLVIPMSYRNVGDVANDPAPLRQSLSGKMIPLELCRKWNRWNMPMLCGSMLTQASSEGNKKQMFFGGADHGNLYWLNPDKFSDDDYGRIFSYYVTCAFFNHETEQTAPGLGLHRKLFEFLSLYISGVGQIKVTPYIDNLNNPWVITPTVWNSLLRKWSSVGTFDAKCTISGTTLTTGSNLPANVAQVVINGTYYTVSSQSPGQLNLATAPGDQANVAFTAVYTPATPPAMPLYSLSANPNHDLEWAMNVRGERMFLKIEALPNSGTDAAFNLQHLVLAGRADRTFPVRGAQAQ